MTMQIVTLSLESYYILLTYFWHSYAIGTFK